MPISHSVDESVRLIRTAGTGDVTAGEVARHLDELGADLREGARHDVLLDFGACTSLPSSDQLREVVARLERIGGKRRFGRCAILARRDALYGMTRMFEVFAEDQFAAIRVFRTTEEAERWLSADR